MFDLDTAIKACEAILPKKHGKYEISHILVDDKNIVATDTVFMLVWPHGTTVEEPVLINNPKASAPLPSIDGVVFGRYPSSKTGAKTYPNYKRILYSAPGDDKFARDTLINSLYALTSETGIIIDYVKYAQRLKKLDKLLGGVKSVLYPAKNEPVTVRFKNGAILMIMPVVL